MTFPFAPAAVRDIFIAACLAELSAVKPGNVHAHGAGHGMEVRHFEDAALAAAPAIADQGAKVGARILAAQEASFAAAGLNANLGILLLAAPLAAAAELERAPAALQRRLSRILAELDREDAEAVYTAIRQANPGGLGRAPAQDVAGTPAIGLREAMALAADRDRIAHAYVTDFADVFEFGRERLAAARRHAESEELAISTLHMCFLAEFPDSHIARKHGLEAALRVREWAREREMLWRPAASTRTFASLLDFDHLLKERSLNPGTTADFVVATLFADKLIAASATSEHP